MTIDTGQHGLARRYYRMALDLADEAEDRTCYAITLRAMSVQALELRRPVSAVNLAEAAVSAAASARDPAVNAFTLAQRARSYARFGEARRVLTDLDAADTEHARARSQPGPFSSYPRAGMEFQRAEALHALGRREDAVTAMRAASHHRLETQRRSSALTHARLAEMLWGAGRLSEARVHWNIFLEHYPLLHSDKAHTALSRLDVRLRAYPRCPDSAAVLNRAKAVRNPSRSGRPAR